VRNGDNAVRDSFPTAVAFVISHEGGYSRDPQDPGGETKFGISRRAYPNIDIAALTEEGAKEIYLRDYWLPIGADDLPTPADIVAFDTAVNLGISFARELLHETNNDVVTMLFYRLRKYSRIVATHPELLKYLRGWLNRVLDLYDYIRQEVRT